MSSIPALRRLLRCGEQKCLLPSTDMAPGVRYGPCVVVILVIVVVAVIYLLSVGHSIASALGIVAAAGGLAEAIAARLAGIAPAAG